MFEGLLQPGHLILILAIALLVFGPKKLPELGKGLGESIRGFKDALSGSAEAPKESAGSPPAPEKTGPASPPDVPKP
jgi:sec-independent protein translocase protein TatA